jgi:uncharacterized protein YrrD
MIRSVKHLKQFAIAATDGAIGSVDDVYFDSERWAIRYLVVDTGGWLSGRRVLISPISVTKTDWGEQHVELAVSRAQVEGSPDIDTHKPVSRQHEVDYLNYYGYPHYWAQMDLWGTTPRPMLPPPSELAAQQTAAERELRQAAAKGDTHLRSAKEVSGYVIRATDGDLGHVDDFLVDDVTWAVRYLVIDTSNWWFGKHVLVAPNWTTGISWADRTVDVRVTRQALRNAPVYDRAKHVDRQWEADYHGHLDQPGYWLDADEARAATKAQAQLR